MTTDLSELRLRLETAKRTLDGVNVPSLDINLQLASAKDYIQEVIDSLNHMMDDSHG